MISEYQMLKLLSQDNWFRPSENTKVFVFDNNEEETLSTSYYHHFPNGETLEFRVANHGTSLDTWVSSLISQPEKSKSNISIVFAQNKLVQSNRKTKRHYFTDENGNLHCDYRIFVVEQYNYYLPNMEKSDVIKIIKKLKQVERENCEFQDPMDNPDKPQLNVKRASAEVLTPQDEDGNPIPYDKNEVHPRQKDILDKLKNKKIDKNSVNPKMVLESKINRIVRDVINEMIYNEKWLLN